MDHACGLGAVGPLGYTMLLCREIAPMRRFYADVLGLTVQREIADRYVELEAGSVVLALRLRSRPYDGPPPSNETASLQLAFRVGPDDVDAAARQLSALGIEPLEPVRDLPDFGHRVLFVADPEHNIVELYAELDDEPDDELTER